VIGLCLGLAGVGWAEVPTPAFPLAWNHTIEKIRWEEDYRVTPDGLLLGEARVKGSGAGMEIPDDAELRDGAWHYQRQMPALPLLRERLTGWPVIVEEGCSRRRHPFFFWFFTISSATCCVE